MNQPQRKANTVEMSNKSEITARSTRRPRLRVLAYASVLGIIATVFVGVSSAASGPKLPAPAGLNTFMTRLDEPRTLSASGVLEYDRTPSFAWKPVAGATRYEFELSTSSVSAPEGFRAANGLVWSSKTLTTPATAIPLSLPWITGEPASLYWHVRAVAGSKVSEWSATKPFNMRWKTLPKQRQTDRPGYLHWSPVDGATSYQVWLLKPNKVISTITNVADEREYFTFHDSPAWTGQVDWRVRAVRAMYGQAKNALPAVSYGPWSTTYHSANPSLVQSGDMAPRETVSDVVSTKGKAKRHALMPAFLFDGNGDSNFGLHRVYVFSDRDCVNVVFRGAIVGGPAYAPRTTGPLDLPKTTADLFAAASKYLSDGDEGKDSYALDTTPVRATEALAGGAGGGQAPAAVPTSSASGGTANASGGGAAAEKSTPKVDLWDRSFPSGRYYWTVVPVLAKVMEAKKTSLLESVPEKSTQITVASAEGISEGTTVRIEGGTPETATVANVTGDRLTLSTPLRFPHGAFNAVTVSGGKIVYQETELPQDSCAMGRSLDFGKESVAAKPVGPRSVPYATGLSPNGRLLSAATAATPFYGPPLVAWEAARAADKYDIEWSHSKYPFRPVGHLRTPATSVVLPLSPGTWWYRVRGINESVPGNQKMSWSDATRILIAKPSFSVQGG
jgi:hypothetical protein